MIDKKAVLNEVFDWLECIVLALAAVLIFLTFGVRGTRVDGSSMMPTLENRQVLVLQRAFFAVDRNDIVVIQANEMKNEWGENGKPIIKRVIGVPGDTLDIDFEHGLITRNGKQLDVIAEGGFLYEDGHAINELTWNQLDFRGEVTVPEGCYFVMGDNRNRSLDSRDSSVGFVDNHYVIGKVLLRFLPISKIGTVD
ncbi:MAG: signal peptidase I [Oscillospiraceae bacterium]|jgi:signal peptidase I|nr:signal peptidase I [Oscillospiraceae bacterium]